MTDAVHQSLIRDQFTRQATPFSTAAPIASEAALRMIIDAARPGPDDTVLDVACGGGIVAHPGGIASGVRGIRQAWEAAVAGIPLEDYARQHTELSQALQKFGA